MEIVNNLIPGNQIPANHWNEVANRANGTYVSSFAQDYEDLLSLATGSEKRAIVDISSGISFLYHGDETKTVISGLFKSVIDYDVDITDSITDQTGRFQNCVDAVGQAGGGVIIVPSGTYNAGVNNNYSNITFIMGGAVKFTKVWHFAVGKNPFVDTSDPNYNATIEFCENVHIIGAVEFGDGGRLGTFCNKNCSVGSLRFSGNHDGVHIYGYTQNFTIGEVYSTSGRHDNGNTGSVFIDEFNGNTGAGTGTITGTLGSDTVTGTGTLFTSEISEGNRLYAGSAYLGIVKSIESNTSLTLTKGSLATATSLFTLIKNGKPKNIRIGKIHTDGAYWNGLYLDCDGFTCDEIDVKNCGLNGVRITNFSRNIRIGGIQTDTVGSYDTPYNFLRMGVTIDGSATEVIIGKIKAVNSYYSNLYIGGNTTNDIHIGEAICINGSNTLYSPTYILSAQRVTIGKLITSGAIIDGFGLELDNVKDILINELETFGNTANGGYIVKNAASDRVTIKNIVAYNNLNPITLGGGGDCFFGRIHCYNNKRNAVWITGLTGSVHINSIIADGTNAEAYYNGFLIENSAGANVVVDNAFIKNYSVAGCKGMYGANATGKFHFKSLSIKNCPTGYDISDAGNSGWQIDQETFTGVTTKRAALPADTIKGYVGAGTTAPTTGSYIETDEWKNSHPTAGSYSAWVCVTSGSPGTWKGIGLIES